jgi:hypothetical protein
MDSFDVPEMPYSALIIGRRASGKTTLVFDLLSKSKIDGNYLAVVPAIESGELYQNKEVSTNPEQYLWDGGRVLVLDGCILEASHWKTAAFSKAITNKHKLIITTSYPPDLNNDIQKKIDYIFLFKETNTNTLQQLYLRYFIGVMSKDEFDKAMDALNPYECIVLDNRLKKSIVYKVSESREPK